MSEKSDCFKFETIREQRQSRVLSIREVARDLNVSPSYLSGLECGKFVPSLQRLLQIQAYFENSLAEYFRDDSRMGLIEA